MGDSGIEAATTRRGGNEASLHAENGGKTGDGPLKAKVRSRKRWIMPITTDWSRKMLWRARRR